MNTVDINHILTFFDDKIGEYLAGHSIPFPLAFHGRRS